MLLLVSVEIWRERRWFLAADDIEPVGKDIGNFIYMNKISLLSLSLSLCRTLMGPYGVDRAVHLMQFSDCENGLGEYIWQNRLFALHVLTNDQCDKLNK